MDCMPKLLRPKEVATALSLSEQRLAELRLKGGGPDFVKIGRSVHYRPQAIQDWVAQNSRKSTSDTGERCAA